MQSNVTNNTNLKAHPTHPFMREKAACAEVSMGRTAFRVWAKEIGARRKVGGILLYDMDVIYTALQRGEALDS